MEVSRLKGEKQVMTQSMDISCIIWQSCKKKNMPDKEAGKWLMTTCLCVSMQMPCECGMVYKKRN